jgi:AsmA protein
MRSLLKFIAAVIGVLVLLAIIGIVCVVLLVNPNNFKTQISKQVYTSTGRQLSIGNVSWTIFPWLGIKANDISLSDPPSFDNKIFAQAKQAELAAKLGSLLEGHIELGQLSIDELTLNLVKNAQGVTNWQDLIKIANSKESSSTQADQETFSVSGKKKLMITLSGIAIKDANLNWQDQQQNKNIAINNLQFNVNRLSLIQAFPLSASFELNTNKPQFSGNFKLNSDIAFNKEQQLLTLDNLQLNVSLLNPKYTGGHLDTTLNTDAIFDVRKQEVLLSNTTASVANMNMTGKLQKLSLNKLKQINGTVQIPSFNVKQFLVAIGTMSPSNKFLSDNLTTSLNAAINYDGTKNRVSLSNMDATIANVHLRGDLQGQSLNKNMRLNGTLQIPSFNLKQFLNAVGKSSSSVPGKVQNVGASFQLQASLSGMSLNKLQANLDNTHVDGNLTVTNYAHPAYQFKLNIDNVDLSQSSSTNTSTVNNTNNPNKPAVDQSGLLPVAMLSTLNANGQLSVNKLSLSKVIITSFYTQINAKNGVMQLSPLNGGIFQGTMQNNVVINVRGSAPQFKIASNFSGIQIDPLLTSLADITRIKVSGTGNLSANVTATGNSSSDIKRTLSGSTKFSVNNGILYGIDIPYYSDIADSLFNKQVPTGTNTHQTSFGNLTGTANVTNGLVSNNDLLVQAPDIKVTGKGTANLLSEQLNYTMKMQRMVSGTPKGPAIPLIVKGTFSHPSIQPDVTEIIKDQAVRQLEQQVSKKLQKAIGGSEGEQQLENDIDKGNIGQQLQKGLKSFLGQ